MTEFSLQISPETWSDEIRKFQGKAYSYGFKRLFKDLRAHYNALTSNFWKNYLNYEGTLSREELVWHSYDVADKLLDVKVKYAYLTQEEYVETKHLLHRSWELYQQLEEAEAKQDTLNIENVPGLDASLLTTDSDLYFGNYRILNFRSFLRFVRKKLFG